MRKQIEQSKTRGGKAPLFHLELETIALIFISILLFHSFFISILKPAYISAGIDCNNAKIAQIAYNQGYAIAGYYLTKNDSIELNNDLNSLEYNRTLIHEEVHRLQRIENRLGNCGEPITLFFNEEEAYISEYLFS